MTGQMGNYLNIHKNSDENESTKNSHHILKLLTLQCLPHMSIHACHMWVDNDDLTDSLNGLNPAITLNSI